MKTKPFNESFNRTGLTADVREKWLEYIRQSRRVYFFQKWMDLKKEGNISFAEIAEWIYEDINHIVRWNINIFFQLREYGALIKKMYGLSYFQQWYRMVYLVIVIRANATRFRKTHLFKNERWSRVRYFSFSRHYKIQVEMLGYPKQSEIELLENKYKFFEYCRSRGLKTPEIHAVFEEGKVRTPSEKLFAVPKRDLFVKELSAGQGLGAKKFFYKENYYQDTDGNIYKEKDIFDFLTEYSKNKNSIIVQDALRNHNSWKKFTNGSLSTCRIVTGISPDNENDIIPFFAALRMPHGNSDIDNFSKGAIAASIDIDSGILTSAVTGIPKNRRFSFDIHPDTGHLIKGEVIPYWDEIIDFVKRFHLNFKTLSIGWDVSVTEQGLSMIEGNIEWGSDVIEGPAGVVIADSIFPVWIDKWIKKMHQTKI